MGSVEPINIVVLSADDHAVHPHSFMSTCHISLTAWKVGYLLISYLTFIRVWTHLFYMQNGSQEQKSNRDTQSSRRSVLKGSLVAIGMGGSLSGVAAGKGGKGKRKEKRVAEMAAKRATPGLDPTIQQVKESVVMATNPRYSRCGLAKTTTREPSRSAMMKTIST